MQPLLSVPAAPLRSPEHAVTGCSWCLCPCSFLPADTPPAAGQRAALAAAACALAALLSSPAPACAEEVGSLQPAALGQPSRSMPELYGRLRIVGGRQSRDASSTAVYSLASCLRAAGQPSRRDAAPAQHAPTALLHSLSPQITPVYFGNGCFWGRQVRGWGRPVQLTPQGYSLRACSISRQMVGSVAASCMRAAWWPSIATQPGVQPALSLHAASASARLPADGPMPPLSHPPTPTPHTHPTPHPRLALHRSLIM